MLRHLKAPVGASGIRGAGVVELMVAATIGMVLIAGALTVFSNSRKSYAVNQSVSRMLENGNFALDEMTRSLQMAGYWGRNTEGGLVRRRFGDATFTPLSTTTPATNDCFAGWYVNVERRVEGLNDENTAYEGTCIPDDRYAGGTDILVVRHVEPDEVATASLQANTVYIRSDPLTAELFIGTAEPTGQTSIAANYELRAMAFYVSNFSLVAGDNVPALRRVELSAGAAGPELVVESTPSANEIVVPGVENMQLQFGLSSTGDEKSANQYLNADRVGANDWPNVVSVRIWVLVRAEAPEPGYENTTTYQLPSGPFTPSTGDAFRRLLLTRTITLRNF